MKWRKLDEDTSGERYNDFVKWRDNGQELQGIWLGKKKGKFGYFGIVDTVLGNVPFSMPTVLVSKLSKIPEHQSIKIIYLGKERGESGYEYHNFDVYVEED